jgi:oleandomycin transport system permease protein
VFGLILGFRFGTDPLSVVGALALVMAFAFALCWVFTALALVVGQPRSVQGLSVLVILPLTFGSNVFVPADTMPPWLRWFVEVNPVSAVANAVRGLLTGGPVLGPATIALVFAAAITAVFAPLAVTLYRRRT